MSQIFCLKLLLKLIWFLLQQSKLIQKLEKYKIHQGEIIIKGRIIEKIKEIRLDKNKNKQNNQFNIINNSQNKNNSINSKNNLILKEIDDDMLFN